MWSRLRPLPAYGSRLPAPAPTQSNPRREAASASDRRPSTVAARSGCGKDYETVRAGRTRSRGRRRSSTSAFSFRWCQIRRSAIRRKIRRILPVAEQPMPGRVELDVALRSVCDRLRRPHVPFTDRAVLVNTERCQWRLAVLLGKYCHLLQQLADPVRDEDSGSDPRHLLDAQCEFLIGNQAVIFPRRVDQFVQRNRNPLLQSVRLRHTRAIVHPIDPGEPPASF